MNDFTLHHKKVADLIPYINNSRTHSDEQISQVAASINEFGFTNPILIDEKNSIIAGHGRLMAAKKLSLDEIPCIVLAGLTEAQKKAYVIADNQIATNSGWDFEKLKLELENLGELDFNIDLVGFDKNFLSGLYSDDDDSGSNDPANDNDEFIIIINCVGEHEQQALYEELSGRNFNVKLMD